MAVWINRLSKALTVVIDSAVTLAFLTLLVLVIVLVILRYGFSASIVGGDELIEFLFIFTSAVGAAAVLGRRQHVSIPTFWRRMAPPIRKAFDTVNHLLIMVLNGYMIALSRTWIAGVGHNRSYMLHIPMWVVQISIPIGCGLAMVYCLFNILGSFTEGARGKGGCR